MQNKNSDVLVNEIIDILDKYFGGKIGDYVISGKTDTPYVMFSIRFTMYNFFNVILNYDRGAFGCAIINGEYGVDIDSSQEWYDKADMNIFLQELEQQIELRIPDKFLEFHGWKSN